MKKSISLFFLIVFSISLPGFSIELHFCKGKITDVAVFGHADCSCETPRESVAVHTNQKSSCKKHCNKTESVQAEKTADLLQKNCCKTEKLTLTSSKLKALSSLKTSQVVLFAVAILNPYAISDRFEEAEQEFIPYIPPLIARDLTILHRVFVI